MLNSIELRNFLAFEHARLNLRALTVLTGLNSAGKSSVIHALAVLRQSADAGYLDRGTEGTILLNGAFVNLGNGRDVLNDTPSESGEGDRLGIGISFDEDGETYAWFAKYEAESDGLTVTAGEDPIRPSDFMTGPFEYIAADRLTPQLTYPKSYRDVTSSGTRLGLRGEHAANFLRVHADAAIANPRARHRTVDNLNLLDNVNAWIGELALGTSLEVVDVPGTDFVSLNYFRQGPQVRTKPQRATNVGFGLSYVLPVIVACLMADAGNTILIENPEAHLHPAAQAAVGTLCALAASTGAQIFVETHSDHVVNGIRLAVKRGEIAPDDVLFHFFSRDTDQLQPVMAEIEVLADGTVTDWPEGFFDEWDRSLSRLLN